MEVDQDFLYMRGENSGDDSSWNEELLLDHHDAALRLTQNEAKERMEPEVNVVEIKHTNENENIDKCETDREHTNENEYIDQCETEMKHRNENENIYQGKTDWNIGAPGWNVQAHGWNVGVPYWNVGAPCQARYSVDNVLYEARIVSINHEKETCRVKYVGYNDEEDVPLKSLKKSRGAIARKEQKRRAKSDLGGQLKNSSNQDHNLPPPQSNSFSHYDQLAAPQFHQSTIPQLIPPPLSCFNEFENDDNRGALSSMLMSWYMSGYHTGYYVGLKAYKKKHNVKE